MKRTLTFICALLLTAVALCAQPWEQRYSDLGYAVESTQICGRNATIIQPPHANGRWIVRPAFMGAFPQVDEALLERGWTFGYFDVTDEYACAEAQAAFTEFYNYARTKYNLSEKVTLEGLSRGGWFSLIYAENNPEKIEKLYLDAPLSDLDLFKGRELYDKILNQWEKDGVERSGVHDYARRHFDRIKHIPIILVYGAADEIVRFENQFGTFDLSGCKELSMIGKTGCGHHPHSLSPCDTIVNFIAKPVALPRAEPTLEQKIAFEKCISDFQNAGSDLHSLMVLQGGKVLYEKWLGEWTPDKPHPLWSCSKTFTSAAVGFAIDEGYFKLDDKVVDFFPDKRPRKMSKNLKAMTVRDLLTMTCGHPSDPTYVAWEGDGEWMKFFLSYEVRYQPGTQFCYNSLGTYMLSAIVQRTTGQKLADYITPRLFDPLGIVDHHWDESPEGVTCGGWGLSLRTEDLAKMGQCLLQGGKWEGRQVIPAWWAAEMGKCQVECIPGGQLPENAEQFRTPEVRAVNDWCQGYGYQMWRCRHNGYRADGASSQYIVVFPDRDVVIVDTAHDDNMQRVLNFLWDDLLPVLPEK